MAKVKRIDPSETGSLRYSFLRDINKRLALLYREIKKFLVEDDVLGLEPRKPLVIQAIPGEYAFASNPMKLQVFQNWLDEQVTAGFLIVSGIGIAGQPWTYPYVESAYKQGITRAYEAINKEALAETLDFYQGTRHQFLQSSFNQSVATGKIQLLSMRTFEQMKGITAAVGQQLNRILADGLLQGDGPLVVAREMQKSIAGISRSRARMIARTEIIHAHAEGQLDSFALLGVEKLGILAEWSTAGDDRVCADCGAYEGEVFSIEEARGLIPLHPNCRCAWIPSEQAIG